MNSISHCHFEPEREIWICISNEISPTSLFEMTSVNLMVIASEYNERGKLMNIIEPGDCRVRPLAFLEYNYFLLFDITKEHERLN